MNSPSEERMAETAPLLRKNPQNDDKALDSHAWWNELWLLCKYTAPVIGTQLLEHSLVMASVISTGHLSTSALAGASLGSMTATVTGYSIIQGLVSALDSLLPGSWTSPHPELVGLWTQRMTIIIAFALFPIAFAWLNAENILLFLRQEAEVARIAGIFLRWSLPGLPAYAFNNISRRYFQSQGLFTVPARIGMIIAPFNALLNYLLVWGPEPIRLGFIGAPIATAISMNLMAVLCTLYGIYYVPRTAWHPFSRLAFRSLPVALRLSLSGVGQIVSEWWSWEFFGLAASFIDSTSLAAQSILLISATTSHHGFFGTSTAASVRVGNLLGEGNSKRASLAARMSLLMTLGVAAVMSTIFFTFRHTWGLIFSNDPAVVSLVSQTLPLVALFALFDGQGATIGGILRASGRQFTGALLNFSAHYIVGIPVGFILAFKFDMGLSGLWIGLVVALVYCTIVGIWLNFRTDWNFEVQKVCERIEKERRKMVQMQSQHSV